MQLTLIIAVDSDAEPQQLISEVVSALEFDLRTTVKNAVVVADDGTEACRYEEKSA